MEKFLDRRQAGQLLGKELLNSPRLKITPNDVVLGVPKGGVVVAGEIAEMFNLPLEVVVGKRIFFRGHFGSLGSDVADGAVGMSGQIMFMGLDENDKFEKYEDDFMFRVSVNEAWEEVQTRMASYDISLPKLSKIVKDRRVIFVDDGIATGVTTMVCLAEITDMKPSEIVLAAPVIDPLARLAITDQFEQINTIVTFGWKLGANSISDHYVNWDDVPQQSVMEILEKNRSLKK